MEFSTTSPLPAFMSEWKKEVLETKSMSVSTSIWLNFWAAMNAILNDKRVTKKEWANERVYWFLNNGILSLHKEDWVDYNWIVNDWDLSWQDWIVIN
jgi:hypothetical protein